MLKLVAKRLVWAVPIVIVVSFIVFVMLDLAPTDPAVALAGSSGDREVIAQIHKELRLDDPLPVRYGRWLGNAVQGDLGRSFLTRQPVAPALWARLPVTLSLAFLTLVFSTTIGLSLGIVGALRPRGIVDRLITTGASLTIAMPQFWLALLLVLYLSVYRGWFPAIGYVPITRSPWEWMRHLVLPALALSTQSAATVALQLKGSLVETLGRDYILTARAKGLVGPTIILKHALRNAAVPVLTIFGLQVTTLLGGAVVIEQIFGLNGLGTLLISSAQNGDINPLLGLVMMFTIVAILMNALVDIGYGYLNPRLRS